MSGEKGKINCNMSALWHTTSHKKSRRLILRDWHGQNPRTLMSENHELLSEA